MIYIRPGSRVHTMLTLFSVVNEFPFRSLHLLGNERVYQKLVWEYCHPQTFCLERTDKTITTKLFTFEDSERTYGRGNYDYDGHVDGANIFVAFDGDIARPIRFRNALGRTDRPNEVVCFPHQAKFLREYLGKDVVIKTVKMEVLEKKLGIVENGEEERKRYKE